MTLAKTYFRTFEKIKKKTAANQRIQEELEKKLDRVKDVTKWESILALTFEVSIDFYLKYILTFCNNFETLYFLLNFTLIKLLFIGSVRPIKVW